MRSDINFILPRKPDVAIQSGPGTRWLISIVGPTATGKTELGIILARYYQTEIISADSRQLYKEMNIGTAKPSKNELAAATHHFIDHLSVVKDYSAGQFEKEALEKLEELFKKHHILILAGGTGLYIDALLNGLDKFPPVDKEVREKLNHLWEEKGIEHLQQLLLEKDPEHYKKVDLNNPQRLIRALEVSIGTGKPYSSFRTGAKKKRPFEVIKIGLFPGRAVLNERIETRVEQMMEEGLLEEVKSLLPYRDNNALQTVGYPELFGYIDGKYSIEKAVELIKQNSRQYAKRQTTWFKRDKEIKWFDGSNGDEVMKYIDTLTQKK